MDRSSPLDPSLAHGDASLVSAADVARFEAIPYDERIVVQSTYQALGLGAALDPAAPALSFLAQADPDEAPLVISHARLVEGVTQTANFFIDLGVGPSDVVSILLPLVPQSFFALFGAQAAAIANPVNPLLSAEQIAEILRAAGTKVLVALGPVPGSDIWGKLQQLRGKLPALKAIVVVGGGASLDPGMHDFDAAIATRPADRLRRARPIGAADTAAYFHTGGTTGLPKLVRHSHRNEVYQAWAVRLMLPVGQCRTVLFGLPLFHVGGALTQGLATLCSGGHLAVVSPAGWRDPNAIRNVWRLVERFRPAIFGGVPTVLAAALQVPIGDADVSSIECVSGGGSAIPLAVGRAYVALLGKPVLEVYGMTETSSVHTMAYADRPVRLGSVGHPLPYSRVRVVKLDAAGSLLGDCAIGEIGVIAMAGPGVFSGYVSEAHNASAFVAPGWVNSGDLGRIEADGTLWLTGRAKDLVIRGGHNIDPLAIEEVFFQHPTVAMVAVVGQPDAHAGELPVAFVQARPGVAIDPAELLDFVRERTPERAAVPVAIHVLDAIPLTAVGKVFKPALRWEATRRAVVPQLAELAEGKLTIDVEVGPHETHGSLITVRVGGAARAQREALARLVHGRLDPLVTRHEIVWS
jgi:fatty-acyl-CoA synthase